MTLRLRIALFFAAIALGGLALIALGLYVGHGRSAATETGPFVTAGLIAAFGLAGMVALVWLLFDENVAKPIERLASDLRSRAHADLTSEIDHDPSGFLGDLGPAARALSQRVGEQNMRAAERVAAETARLMTERAHLTAVLSEIPVAVLMVSEDHRIVLYDGQAAQALERIRPLVLGQSLFDHVDRDQVERALGALTGQGDSTGLQLSTVDGHFVFEAHLRRLGEAAGYMLTLQTEPSAEAARPLVFDFDLFSRTPPRDIRAMPLRDMVCVVFDTETTGLLPDRDDVVQIGAVRIVGGRKVEGEVFDTLVNPGRPIPPSSTKIHGVDDAMVRGAPAMAEAAARFRHFCEGAVMVAHNAPFDMAFLQRAAAEAGAGLDNPVLDTVLLSAELFGHNVPHTLDAIADRLEVTIPDVLRHTALGDAEATAAVLLKMLSVLEARGCATLGDLLSAQKKHTRLVADLNADRAPAN